MFQRHGRREQKHGGEGEEERDRGGGYRYGDPGDTEEKEKTAGSSNGVESRRCLDVSSGSHRLSHARRLERALHVTLRLTRR